MTTVSLLFGIEDRPRTQTTPLISLSAVSPVLYYFTRFGIGGTSLIQCLSSTADTVVLTHALPSTALEMELGTRQELLEKPISKEDHLRMLQDLNGNVCEVVTGVSLGERFGFIFQMGRLVANNSVFLVFPVLTAPGYATRYGVL